MKNIKLNINKYQKITRIQSIDLKKKKVINIEKKLFNNYVWTDSLYS